MMIAILAGGCDRGSGPAEEEPVSALAPVVDAPVEVEAAGEIDPVADPAARRGGSITTWGGPFPKSFNYWIDLQSTNAELMGYLFEPLAGLHPVEDRPVGVLAQGWEIAPDKRSYTFRIDPRARWSDGRPVTAADVRFYYDTMMDPKNLTSVFRIDLSRFDPPEVLGEREIRMRAREVHWSNFWTACGMFAFPRQAWEGRDFNEIHFEFPVVSGPYRLAEVKTNRYALLQRRGDWWGRARRMNLHRYNFDAIRYRFMEDRNKALEVFKKGDIDIYAIYTGEIWARQTRFPAVERGWVVRQRVYNREPRAFQGLAMNLRRPLFGDVRVRRALSHLLNREAMNEKLMYKSYFLLNSYFPDLYPGGRSPDAPLYNYDPDRARALLAEAGWEADRRGMLARDGAPLSLVLLHHGDDTRHLEFYREALLRVGIDARIEIVSASTFTRRVQKFDFDMIWRNWAGGRMQDPEPLWYSKEADHEATNNICGVKDPEIDALIDEQRVEMDEGGRKGILRRIDRRLTEIVPYVLMWQADHHRLLYWNRFGRPTGVLDKFNREDSAPVYWWADAGRDGALARARAAGESLPMEPSEVRLWP